MPALIGSSSQNVGGAADTPSTPEIDVELPLGEIDQGGEFVPETDAVN